MKNILFLLAVCSFLPAISIAQNHLVAPEIQAGVSQSLAEYRSAMISEINYVLSFNVPAEKGLPVSAKEKISFFLNNKKNDLQIDFKSDAAQIKMLEVNDRKVSVQLEKEHLIIRSQYLNEEGNTILINWETASPALNRNEDYLYTLLVPDRARTLFPCFDQPDLKATYSLSLEIPKHWNAIANGSLKDSAIVDDRKTYHFATSDKISTYLFSFTAGNFKTITGRVANTTAQFLYRETDSVKITKSIDSVFQAHTDAVNFLQSWTKIPYPFQKIGFAAIPDFQFGGMEHPGAVQYKASSLFLDAGATKDQFISRASLISHETAHMWFGDMVSIKWFNDVWMKEVFANFMADKVAEKLTGKESYDLKFLTDHFPAAYNIDRTKGANPIRQVLNNLNEAGSLYGNIIYHKAPIMMRQLERLMGKDSFQLGVSEYLKKFAYKNASWPDLINILSNYTSADLREWNRVWVNDNGRPVILYHLESKGNKITHLILTQGPESGAQRLWPQIVEITLYYPGSEKQITVHLNNINTEVKEVQGMKTPKYILFNSGGEGYGLWPVDKSILEDLYHLKSPVSRASVYISLYENMLDKRSVTSHELLTLFMKGIGQEKEELNLKLLTSYISTIFWEFSLPADRNKIVRSLEENLWESINKEPSANLKKILFKTYQEIFLSKDAFQHLYEIWNLQQAPAGIKLAEDDYTALALALKIRDNNDTLILNTQLKRIRNTDRIKRFEFMMPAVSGNEKERIQFFESLKDRKNREKESNVVAALNYLHHPLRQNSSIQFLKPGLDLLQEIQLTGDIFFPQSWLLAMLGNYQSPEADKIVREFLSAHPSYNPRLKAKLLQASDNLSRAQYLLYNK